MKLGPGCSLYNTVRLLLVLEVIRSVNMNLVNN